MWSCSGHLLQKEPEASVPQQNTLEGESRIRGTYRVSLSKLPTLLPSVSILHKHDQTRRALCEKEARKGAEFPGT